MIRLRSGALIAAALMLVSACSLLDPPAARGPADPDAVMAPDLITADPAVVAPGGVVGLGFPEDTTRGVLFVLERRAGDAWDHRYNLLSDGPGPDWQRAWHPADEGPLAVEDIGVGGPGPDRVPIPEVAEPGDYRICTGNAAPNICTPIRIGS
jgi:hypothetical protein